MTKAPATQMYWSDLDRDTCQLSNEELGGYMRIFMHLWFSDSQGKSVKTLKQWARVMRTDIEEARSTILALFKENVCHIVTASHENVTLESAMSDTVIKIVNRRMHREYSLKKSDAERQQRRRDTKKGNSHTNVTPKSANVSRPSTSTSTTTHTSSSDDRDTDDDDDVILKARNKLDELGFVDSGKLVKCHGKALFVLESIQQNPDGNGGLIRKVITNEYKYKAFKNQLSLERECQAIPMGTILFSPKRGQEGIWTKDEFDLYGVKVADRIINIGELSDLREWVLLERAENE